MSFFEGFKYKLFPPKNTFEIAKLLTEKIASESFTFFKEPRFRELINFEKISQTEQDRIFNEIVATGIALSVVMFEKLAALAPHEEIRQFYAELQLEMRSYYANWLKELGTPQKFTDLWKQLIKMRTDEYEKDYQTHQKELERDWKKNPWVFVATYGGYHHLRRGKGKSEDPLFKMFLKWNIKIANQITEILKKILK